ARTGAAPMRHEARSRSVGVHDPDVVAGVRAVVSGIGDAAAVGRPRRKGRRTVPVAEPTRAAARDEGQGLRQAPGPRLQLDGVDVRRRAVGMAERDLRAGPRPGEAVLVARGKATVERTLGLLLADDERVPDRQDEGEADEDDKATDDRRGNDYDHAHLCHAPPSTRRCPCKAYTTETG